MTRGTTLGLAARAQAAHDIVRAVGPLGALTVLPRWLVRREFVVFAMPLHEAVPGPPPHGLRLAPLTETELPELERLHPAMTEAEVRRRWREGQECDVGWVGSHAAYYQWLTTGTVLRIGATHHDTRRPPCTTAW